MPTPTAPDPLNRKKPLIIGGTNPRIVAAATVAACLFATGCSSASTATGTNSAQPGPPSSSHANSHKPANASTSAAPATITIKDFSYTLSGGAAGGSTVMVTNNDSETHTITADFSQAFEVTVEAGKTTELTAPTQPGNYKFHCNFHSNMHGTLVVS